MSLLCCYSRNETVVCVIGIVIGIVPSVRPSVEDVQKELKSTTTVFANRFVEECQTNYQQRPTNRQSARAISAAVLAGFFDRDLNRRHES